MKTRPYRFRGPLVEMLGIATILLILIGPPVAVAFVIIRVLLRLL